MHVIHNNIACDFFSSSLLCAHSVDMDTSISIQWILNAFTFCWMRIIWRFMLNKATSVRYYIIISRWKRSQI